MVEVTDQSILDILAERDRQLGEKGYTREQDKRRHIELANGAAARLAGPYNPFGRALYPWHPSTWKFQPDRQELVKGAALAIAALQAYDDRFPDHRARLEAVRK